MSNALKRAARWPVELLARFVKRTAWRTGGLRGLYLRLCRPSAREYTEFLRLHGGFYSIGENCSILPSTNITDPAFVRIGNNVHFSNCAIIGHDGAAGMLSFAYGIRLDSVGKIDIRDNVFIGYGAVVLPNVSIGPNAIVAAGAVVLTDVAPGDIVGGIPARPIGKVADLVEKLKVKTEALPWKDLLDSHGLHYHNPGIEAELTRLRVQYFYSDDHEGR